jgi:translation elongation factor EF-4
VTKEHEKRVIRPSLKCHSGGQYQIEDILMDIFSSLPFPAGTANTPKNVIVVDVFYRA